MSWTASLSRTGRGQRAVTKAAPVNGAAPAHDPGDAGPVGPSWPIRSGTIPALAPGYIRRLEPAPDLTALPAGGAAALVPDREAGTGPAAGPAGRDWLRLSGKTQVAAAFA